VDTLESMRAFVRVVELGGFAAAARSLGLSPAMVTKHVAHLESRTGARLLNRTTRQVRTTEAGQAYYERCVELMAGIEEAESAAGAATAQPRGTLRVTAPVEFGNAHLAGLAAQFMQREAAVTLMLDFSNRVVDIVEEGYDVAIRIAESLDTRLAGRKLATSRMHAVASPQYLRRHGRPRTPAALADRPGLCFAVPAPRDTWRFAREGRALKVAVNARLLSTSSEALRHAAGVGAGVAVLPSFVCGEDLRAGRLVSLFPDYDAGALGIYAVYPHRRLLAAKVRAFLDLLVERFGADPEADPWEAGPERARRRARRT